MGGAVCYAEEALPPARSETALINVLGLQILKRMDNQNVSPDGNIVLSPTGLASTLGILQPGARGNTKSLLDNAIGPLQDVSRFADEWKIIRHNNVVRLKRAERLFLSDQFPLDDFYPAQNSVSKINFAQNPEQATRTINKWAEAQTNGIFLLSLTDGAIGESTPMIAVGAFYFSGQWTQAFPEQSIAKGNFRSGTRTVEATMMSHNIKVPYAITPEYTMLALPYAAKEQHSKTAPLYMVMIMPPETMELRAFLKDLTPERLQNILPSASGMQTGDIHAVVPSFNAVTAYPGTLKPFLEFAGLGNLFDPGQADFSGIVSGQQPGPLFLGDLVQQCLVIVNGHGRKDASSDASPVEPANPDQLPVVKIDRPFLWCIYDSNDGAILFMGTEYSPEKFIPDPYATEEYEDDLSERAPLDPLNQLHRQETDDALKKIPLPALEGKE